jgi:signal transduction histidine kinase
LINNLQELDKIEAGLDAERRPVQMQMIVQYALQGLRQQLERKAQQLEFIVPDDLPWVLGNPIQLRQVANHLLDNAIKYTPASGYIRVELSIESDFVLLAVSDTGVGILPEDQPYIFSKFYRASNVTDMPGTGLGLSIVQSIVEQHGGRIWVESQIEQGTTFTVMLPCYSDAASHPAS